VTQVTSSGKVIAAAISPDDTSLKIWNWEREHQLFSLEGHRAYVRDIAVSGDGRIAFSSGGDMHVTAELKIWDVEKGCEILTLPAHHTQLVDAIAVSLNGGIAVSASRDKTLRVWDVAKGASLPSSLATVSLNAVQSLMTAI
jgi:WD40 repeat protein